MQPNRTRTRMTPMRKTALVAGVLYIVTFLTSIPVTFGLYNDILDKQAFVLGVGTSAGVPWGALLEVISALAGIGTAVALYSVAKQQSERLALGFVTSRVIEAAMIMVGVVSLLAVYTLRQDASGIAGADSGSLLVTSTSLVALHDWTFLLGPGVMPALNALCIGTVMYRSRLIPRLIPTIGLIGAPLLLASATATLFGAWDQTSSTAALFALPIAAWELSFGCWMIFKGFRSTAITADPVPALAEPVDHRATASVG